MLISPLPNLEAWTAHFASTDIPVLRSTAAGLDALRPREDSVSAKVLADVMLADPLATARLFAFMAGRRSSRQVTEITSIEGCIVMLGVPPFLEAFRDPVMVEQGLLGRPDGLRGLIRVIRRSRRAARFAWQFGVWRQDPGVGEITIAALLHDIAEALIWATAPDLALKIKAMQRADPGLRSRIAQKMVLNVEIEALQLALARQWRLPEFFVTMMDPQQARNARVRNALYAVNLARHSATGWDNAALPDDYRQIGELLNTSAEHVREMVESE